MRCNWHRWLWGLIPLIALGWLAVVVERGRIEQDLVQRADRALSETGSPWASVAISGRDAMLTGRALLDDQPPKAEATLRRVWGVRDVDNRAILPRKVEPFLWSARRRGNRVRLSGYVPDRATRQTVIGLTKAALPGLDVTDRMNTARGVPPVDTWLAGLSFALKQLSSMRRGDVRYEDLSLSITGEAEDPAAFKSLNAAIKSGMPKGIQLADLQIRAPAVSPFTWTAQLAGGQLVVAGYVSGDDGARESLTAAAKAAFSGINVVDRMEQAEGAPRGWANVAAALMRELAPLQNGMIEMKDAAFSVGAVAADQGQAEAARAALRAAVPPAFKLVDQIRVREPVKASEPKPAEPKSSEPKLAEPKPAEIKTLDVKPPEPVPFPPVPPAPPEPSPQRAAAPPAAPAPATDAAPKQAPEPAQPAPKVAVAPAAPSAAEAPAKQTVPPPSAQPSPPALAPPPASAAHQPPSLPPVTPAPGPKIVAAPPPPPARPALSPAAQACQVSLKRISSAGYILFATDSAVLDTASFDTLDRLAVAAKACPGMRIAIQGHTDNEGSGDYNQRLSEQRAQAVVAYLVKAGADRVQLEAVGYGFTRPTAPNDTPENMARNRRIEFSVRKQ
jgi:outer membrane protein OmpA-like peptidoglycan-associated protein